MNQLKKSSSQSFLSMCNTWLEMPNMNIRQSLLLFFIIPLTISYFFIDRFIDTKNSQSQSYEDYSQLSPLILAGHIVYLEEGCSHCHTQNILNMPTEYQRFAPKLEQDRLPKLSKLQNIQYETFVQLGSRRIGPDLSRIHGRLSRDQLRVLLTLKNKRLRSIMHPYGFLFDEPVDALAIAWKIRLLMQTSPHIYFSDAYQQSVFSKLKGYNKGDALIAYLLSRGQQIYQHERNFYQR